jgi:hypothetical protein
MLTALTALLITSLVGGVFGSVATYTYIDSSEGKYCDRMSDDVSPEDNIYGDSYSGEEDYNSNYYNYSEEEDSGDY